MKIKQELFDTFDEYFNGTNQRLQIIKNFRMNAVRFFNITSNLPEELQYTIAMMLGNKSINQSYTYIKSYIKSYIFYLKYDFMWYLKNYPHIFYVLLKP